MVTAGGRQDHSPCPLSSFLLFLPQRLAEWIWGQQAPNEEQGHPVLTQPLQRGDLGHVTSPFCSVSQSGEPEALMGVLLCHGALWLQWDTVKTANVHGTCGSIMGVQDHGVLALDCRNGKLEVSGQKACAQKGGSKRSRQSACREKGPPRGCRLLGGQVPAGQPATVLPLAAHILAGSPRRGPLQGWRHLCWPQ